MKPRNARRIVPILASTIVLSACGGGAPTILDDDKANRAAQYLLPASAFPEGYTEQQVTKSEIAKAYNDIDDTWRADKPGCEVPEVYPVGGPYAHRIATNKDLDGMAIAIFPSTIQLNRLRDFAERCGDITGTVDGTTVKQKYEDVTPPRTDSNDTLRMKITATTTVKAKGKRTFGLDTVQYLTYAEMDEYTIATSVQSILTSPSEATLLKSDEMLLKQVAVIKADQP